MSPAPRALLLAALLAVASASGVGARDLIVNLPIVARAGPGLHYREVTTAQPGVVLTLLREGRVWSRVEIDGRKGYVVTADVFGPRPTHVKPPPPVDPNCDYGYPYSGSGQYFATPLNTLRHSEPLGALLGYHVRWPC